MQQSQDRRPSGSRPRPAEGSHYRDPSHSAVGTTHPDAQARARAKASAKRRAKARTQARLKLMMYLLVFAVAIFVLVTVIRSTEDKPETDQPKQTTQTQEEGVSGIEDPVTPHDPVKTSWDPVTFTAEDAALSDNRVICRCDADYEELLLRPLNWDLTESDAKVLIIHTHISESYTQSPGYEYEDEGDYRTGDQAHNMVAVGKRVKEILEKHGVKVIHDTTDYEVPNSDYAYETARDAIEQHFADDPDIVLVLDLHRDAALTESGNQWGPTIEVEGEEIARIAFAVGTNCYIGGDTHWKDNMALTMKLEVMLEKLWPGITREILVSSSSYNQDLPNNFILAEVGAAGNTLPEALRGAECIAKALLEISGGTTE